MIHIEGSWFKDELGRTLLLRGVNLSGSTKVPIGIPSHQREGFFDHRNISFVGRPFPLAEADEHFARLKAWGLPFLRFLVTWEAIEHAGPGQYDEAYLDYVYQLVQKANAHGIALFIDPHQDVWSRFSGGDGAPGWTFEAIGMDMTKFAATGAAIVHNTYGDPFPRMIWPTNYGKLAAFTMFTLFFGGNDFAPKTTIEGMPVQEYLQSHYINAIKQVALRLKGLPNVVGYDTLNEPSDGLIGKSDLNSAAVFALKNGETPTSFQAMLLGAGVPQEVEIWGVQMLQNKLLTKCVLNLEGVNVWRAGYDCVWRQNGVWDFDAQGKARLLRPEHFAVVGDREVDFYRDYFRPFANRYAHAIREVDPQSVIFVEGVPSNIDARHLEWTEADAPNIVHAGHWYDGITLFTKNFTPWLSMDLLERKPIVGRAQILHAFAAQLGRIKMESEVHMRQAPTLIGETGIPFDMQHGKAYRTGDFSLQAQALDATIQGLEANLLSYTLWNYTADNDNAHGDQWNGEDLSIFSPDQQTGTGDLDDGGRALEAVIRPYPRAIAGEPLRASFDMQRRYFMLEFRHNPKVDTPTELYIPNFHYPEGYVVEVSDGYYEMHPKTQTLLYHHGSRQAVHKIEVWDRQLGPVEVIKAKEQRKQLAVGLSTFGLLAGVGVLLARLLRKKKG